MIRYMAYGFELTGMQWLRNIWKKYVPNIEPLVELVPLLLLPDQTSTSFDMTMNQLPLPTRDSSLYHYSSLGTVLSAAMIYQSISLGEYLRAAFAEQRTMCRLKMLSKRYVSDQMHLFNTKTYLIRRSSPTFTLGAGQFLYFR